MAFISHERPELQQIISALNSKAYIYNVLGSQRNNVYYVPKERQDDDLFDEPNKSQSFKL